MDTAEKPAAGNLDLYLLIVRVLGVILFLYSGWTKFSGWPGIVNTLTQAGAPMPLVGGYLAIAAEWGCSALLVLGLFARPAAAGLILYTLGTSLIAHRFWELSGGAFTGQFFAFFKNLDIMLMLGFIVLLGPGRYALSRR